MSLRILGFGSVGRRAAELAESKGLKVTRVADSKGVLEVSSNLQSLIEKKKKKEKVEYNPKVTLLDSLDDNSKTSVIADCSASDKSAQILIKALKQGYGVALANKKPLTDTPEIFKEITSNPKARWEATVGAGLPVIVTAKRLMEGADVINGVQGQFSGTLGFLLSRSDDLRLGGFSDAVKEAEKLGYTEPDPRDDLSGLDVARKALILARYCLGMTDLTLPEVIVEPLYPKEFGKLTVDEFRHRLPLLDKEFANRAIKAHSKGQVLRYAATVSRKNGVRVGIVEVDKESPLGRLKGTGNFISFTTNFYPEGQLIITGPGAGVDVTASAVVADAYELMHRK